MWSYAGDLLRYGALYRGEGVQQHRQCFDVPKVKLFCVSFARVLSFSVARSVNLVQLRCGPWHWAANSNGKKCWAMVREHGHQSCCGFRE